MAGVGLKEMSDTIKSGGKALENVNKNINDAKGVVADVDKNIKDIDAINSISSEEEAELEVDLNKLTGEEAETEGHPAKAQNTEKPQGQNQSGTSGDDPQKSDAMKKSALALATLIVAGPFAMLALAAFMLSQEKEQSKEKSQGQGGEMSLDDALKELGLGEEEIKEINSKADELQSKEELRGQSKERSGNEEALSEKNIEAMIVEDALAREQMHDKDAQVLAGFAEHEAKVEQKQNVGKGEGAKVEGLSGLDPAVAAKARCIGNEMKKNNNVTKVDSGGPSASASITPNLSQGTGGVLVGA